MDFHSVKRKQLQALCKKHKIPANLKNVEMADRLAALLKVDDEKPKEQLVKPCLKNLEDLIVIDEEISEGKEHKKVRFSPQNETFVFEKTNPRAVRAATRRHSMAIGEVQVSKKGRISALEDVKEKGGENAADEQTRKLGAKQIRGVGKRKLSSMKQVEDLQTVPVEKIKPRAMRVTTRRRYSMAIGEDRTKERNLPALEDTKGKGSEYAADEKTRKLGAKKTRCASKRKLSSMEKSVDTVDNSEVGDPVNSVSEAVDIKNRLCHDSSVVEDNQGKSQPLLQTKSPSPLLDKCNSKKDVEGSCEESSLIKELETVIPSPVVVECEPNKGEGSLMKSTKLEILSNEEDQMTWTSNNLESSPLEKCIISNFSNLEDQISIDGMADLNSHPKINEFESSLQKSGDTTDNNCIDHAGKNRGYDQGAEEHTPTSTVKVLNSETIDEERDGITAENDSILCSEVPEGRIMTDVSDVNLGDNHAYNSGGSEYPAESEINHNQEEDESKIKTINEEIEVVISHVPEERNMLDVSDVQPKYSSDWLVNPTESEVNHKQPEGSDMVDDVSDVQMNENHEDATVADQNLEKAGYDQDAKGVTPTAVVNVDIKCTAGTVGTCISDKTEYPADSENDKAAESDSILVVDLSSKVPEVSTMIDVSVVDLGDNHDAYNSDRTEYSAEPDVNHKQVLEGLINSETINEEMTMIDVSDAEMCDNHDAYNSDRIEYSAEPDVHHNQGFEETNDSVDDVSDVQMNDNHEDAVLADQHLEKAGIQEADETNGSLDDTVDTERSYKKVLEEASNSNLNSDEESYGIDTLFQLGYVKDAENMIEVSNVELDKKASPHNGRKTDLVNSVSKFNICIQSSPPSKSTSLDKVGISVPVCELGLQGTYVPSSMIVESEPHNKDVFLNKNSEMEDQFAGTNPDLYNLESQSDIANVKSCSNLKSVDISEMSFMVSNEIVERDDRIGHLGSDNSISTISHNLGDEEEKHSASLVLPDDVIMTDVTGTIEVVPSTTSIVENLKISEGIDYKHELEKKTISPASNVETNDITDASGVQLIDNHEQKGTYVPSSMIVESEPHNKDLFLNKNSEMEDQFAGTNPDLYNLESQSDIANVKSCSNLKSVDISEMSFMESNEIVERDHQIGRLGSDNSISTISHKLGDEEEKHSASLVLPDDVIMTDVTGTIEVVPPTTSIVQNLKISEGIDYKHELEKKTISPASNIETNDITDASGVQLIDNHEQKGTYVPSSMIVESEPHNKDLFLNKNSEMEDQFAGTNPDLYNLESQSDIANVKSCSNLKSVDISEMSFMVSNEIVERDDQIGRLGSDNSISTISHKLGDKEEKHSASLVLPDDVIMTDVTGTIEVVPPATSIVENLKISEGIDYKHELEKKTISPASNIETNDITDASGVQLIDNHEQKVGNASDEESYDLASLFQSAYAEDESGFVDEKLQGGNLYEVSDVELDNNHEKEGLAGENMEVYEENGLINDELQGGNLFEVSDVELDNNHEKEALAGENTEVYEENGLINDELQGGNLYEVFDVEFDNNHEKEALAGENMEFYGENGLINDKFQGGNLFEVSDVELDKNHQNEALAGEDMEVYEENGIASQFQPEYAQDDNVLIDEELQGGENMEVDEEKDAGKTCRETYEVSERLGYVCHPELIMKSSVDEEKIGDENGKYIESREMIEMIGSSPGRAEPVKDFIGLGETCEDSVRLGDVLQGSGEKLNIRSSVIKEKNGDENGTWIESIAKPEEDLIGLAAFERFEQTEQQNGNENFAITYEPEKFDGVTPEIEGADGNVKGVCMEDEILPLNDEAEVSKLDKELVHSELSMTKIEDQCESANVKGVCMEDEISPLNDEAADIKLDKELVNDKGTCKEDEVVPLNDKVENSSLKPNCMMMNQKKRSILIHGTPIRPINTADMKENSNVHLKRELNMGDATAFRPFAKRKALGELHRS